MNLLTLLAAIPVLFVALLVALQVVVRLRSRAMTGKPAPALPGELGARVARSGRALIYFFSPGCAACRPLTPRVEALARKNPDVSAIDVSRHLEVARALQVMATPSTVEIDGGRIVGFHVGVLPDAVVARFAAG